MPKQPPIKRLCYFIGERYRIYERKLYGEPKPWTKDKILQEYRFCNVYRENDKVTRWITKHWRKPHQKDPYVWFAMCVARFINWPDTLEEIGYPIPWKPVQVLRILRDRASRKEKVWTGAYVVSTNGVPIAKATYVVNTVLQGLYSRRKALTPQVGTTLATYCAELRQAMGLSGFMAGQIIADLKYVAPLNNADDWSSWAVSGPGSRRGLNRVLGLDKRAKCSEDEWLVQLQRIHHRVQNMTDIPLHAQDLQSCLCEFDKYERVRNGEGRPRAKYPGI